MRLKNKEYLFLHREKEFNCPMDLTMDYLAGRWKTVVLWYLIKEKKRFSELTRLIPNITEKMLSLQLRQLEADGLIWRQVHAEVPPRVEYGLTEAGQTLIPILKAMSSWGLKQAVKQEIPPASCTTASSAFDQ
ncbi:helix-turn-helix domain-containing protein [Spirosoma sp. KNUC1025]|uniref:winged helix-turn-helix transcriptional regulator n=1 Tax=Spirosoma sp. KNUC1025 TaxID=2894082 RepID=UPI001E4A3CA0|nr:helix-turn-helix domain-containing protein [Spirosoma sp. KNUC1025]UFH57879.1 helix-turn-helix transcriptional regulator [Spirosoma sp. KNUC1025]